MYPVILFTQEACINIKYFDSLIYYYGFVVFILN